MAHGRSYQLNEEPKNWLFEPSVESSKVFSFEKPLEGRWIATGHGPTPTIAKAFLRCGRAEHAGICAALSEPKRGDRLLYVGMTRARDYLVCRRKRYHKWLDHSLTRTTSKLLASSG